MRKMASVKKLSLYFTDSEGDNINQVYHYADSEVESASVKALMQGIIANGAIFNKVPAAMKSAKIITVNETPINIDA